MTEPSVGQTSQEAGSIAGLRVLVVEDEAMILMFLEEALDELGCVMIGPCESVASALAATEEGGYDVALVDLNLRGEKATLVAARLAELGRPFAISSGGDASGLGESASLRKPFREQDVETVLRDLAAQAEKQG